MNEEIDTNKLHDEIRRIAEDSGVSAERLLHPEEHNFTIFVEEPVSKEGYVVQLLGTKRYTWGRRSEDSVFGLDGLLETLDLHGVGTILLQKEVNALDDAEREAKRIAETIIKAGTTVNREIYGFRGGY